MLLIVNADDLGASRAVNRETFELMESGVVSSATLMANGPAFDDAVCEVDRFPQCSFGVHLNLTAFRPLSDSDGIQSILREGALCRDSLNARTILRLQKELERELSLQVERVLDSGVPVTHLDSHHFVHVRTALLPVIGRVQKRFGIRRLRSPFQAIPRERVWSRLRGKIAHFAMRELYWTSGPSAWCEFRDFYSALNRNTLPAFECLELMVHPGTEAKDFMNETSCLRSDWRRLLPPHARLTSYHSIADR